MSSARKGEATKVIPKQGNKLSRAKWVRVGYCLLVIYLVSLVVPHVYCRMAHRCEFANQFNSFAITSAIVIIPIGLLLLWVVNFKCRKEHSILQRVGMVFASLFLLAPFALFALFAVNFTISGAYPNFYLSRQGPDTDYAIDGFTNTFGYKPPESVSEIYFRSYGFEDNHTIFRFRVTDKEFVRNLIRQNSLSESERRDTRYNRDDYPEWWHEKENHNPLRLFTKTNGTPYKAMGMAIWYDPALGLVWYEFYDT